MTPKSVHLSTAAPSPERLTSLVNFQPVLLVRIRPVSTRYIQDEAPRISNGETIVAYQVTDACVIAEADMRLIAAAPDLLDALHQLKSAVEFTPLGVRGIAAVERARAAIAKAEGR